MSEDLAPASSHNLLRKVTIKSEDTSYGRSHNVEFSLCNHTFQWKIDQYVEGMTTDDRSNGTFDVVPILPTFVDIEYDPYMACHQVLQLLSPSSSATSISASVNRHSCGMLHEIVRVLIESICYDQREKVKLLTKSFRSSLFMDMLDNFSQEDIFYLVHKTPNNNTNCGDSKSNSRQSNAHISDKDNCDNGGSAVHVVVEFPLLAEGRLHCAELEYLLHVVSSLRPPVDITLCLSSDDLALPSSFSTRPSLLLPRQHLHHLRHLILPSWDANSTLYDYLPALEESIALSWGHRKRFVSELQQIAAVVEFDPVDFSFVSLSLRLTRNKHFILSIVDLRIPAQFPSSPILLLIHDLLSGSSYPLENKSAGGISTATFFSQEWTPERMAREYFLQLCAEIESMAFGKDNNSFNNGNSGTSKTNSSY